MKEYKLHKINLTDFSDLKEINVTNVEMFLKIKEKDKIKTFKFKMTRYLPQKYRVKIKKSFRVHEISYLVNNKIRLDMKSGKQSLFDLDQDNRIAVLATMSSGKSTFLNALIGEEILPSENQACTGKIFEISSNRNKRGKIEIFKEKDLIEERDLEESDLRLLNEDSEIKNIRINTEFQNIEREIIIYDTPGVNNSQDKNHYKITYEFLEKNRIRNYVYILNATQIGVLDDYKFLIDLKEIVEKNKGKILFLLNKIDCIDQEKESLDKIIDNIKNYLKNIGFEDINLVLVSAYRANILKRGLNGKLKTRREKKEYLNIISEYIERKKIKNYKENEVIEKILKETGIKEVENLLK